MALHFTKDEFLKRKNKTLLTLLLITLTLFFEWFYNHPALRYGGYYLFCIMVFIPVCLYLSQKKLIFIKKKKVIIYLILVSFIIFYSKNIERINEDLKIVKYNNFPLFFSPKQSYNKVELNHKTKVYIPINFSGCWAIKTPCVTGVDHVLVNKKLGYIIFSKKKHIK